MSTDHDLRRQSDSPWTLGQNLVARPAGPVSLYVHIPFCSSRCRYCNFYFETGWSPRVLQRTLDRILGESRQYRRALFGDGPVAIRTVYFGGGTPSVIPPAQMQEFLLEFAAIWSLPGSGLVEFACEVNPESLSRELLAVLAGKGVNRLSIGIQSFDQGALQALGRRAGTAEVEAALELLAQARKNGSWNGRCNLDLICGIPGQSLEASRRDIERALAWHPDHVSLYALTEEAGTPLAQLYASGRRIRPPEELVEAQVEQAARLLESAGYLNYEVSNFAQPGAESQHNLAYWELRPYVGLGPGAVGTLPVSLDGRAAIARLTNPVSMLYSGPSQGGFQPQVEILSARDFLLDHFVVGLRTARGLDLERLEGVFKLAPGSLSQLLAPLIATWVQRGLVEAATAEAHPGLAPHRLALTLAGRTLLNPLLLELMDALQLDDVLQESLDSLSLPDWPHP